jgi:hypothetical protein
MLSATIRSFTASGHGRRFRGVDADEDPSRGAVDRDEEIPAAFFVGHLRQVFHVEVEIAGLIGLERFVRRLLSLRLKLTKISRPMSSQAAVKPGARDVRVHKLPHHGEQIVERQQKHCP